MLNFRKLRIVSIILAVLVLTCVPGFIESVYPLPDKPELTIWTTIDADLSLFDTVVIKDAPGLKPGRKRRVSPPTSKKQRMGQRCY